MSSPPSRGRLTTRIVSPQDHSLSTEDIFSTALEILFTDDTQQSHGVPGESVVYRSPRFGDVFLRIPTHPDDQVSRLLFAHYLWNAGVIAAEAIESASWGDDDDDGDGDGVEGGRDAVDSGHVRWDRRFWDVRGLDVLELGAATALPSLVAALSNARSVTCTDHPSSPAITTNAIESNFKVNVLKRRSDGLSTVSVSASSSTPPNASNPASAPHQDDEKTRDGQVCRDTYVTSSTPTLYQPPIHTETEVHVRGYAWGTTTFYEPDGFGRRATTQPDLRSFDRIIVADCLWMQAQHENLIRTIWTYLRRRDGGGPLPCALVIAGFHTGRAIVRDFVVFATGDPAGMGDGWVQEAEGTGLGGRGIGEGGEEEDVAGRLKAVEIFEVNVDGRRRDWAPERPDETREQSKRWCVCAILARR